MALRPRLRSQPGTRALMVVAMTGYGASADRHRALEAGFAEAISCPTGTS